MSRHSILILLPLLAGCASGPANAPEEHRIYHEVTQADLEHARSTEPVRGSAAALWVNGMGCPLCATNLDRQLLRLKGVTAVNIDMAAGTALVTLDPKAAHPSPAQLGHAVADAGFTLVKVEAR
jgi:copper chaperone CopZ